MMQSYFNILLEFEKTKVNKTIEDTILSGKKGYVCAIEANNLAIANRDISFNKIVNNALVNICDGANIAALAGHIHKQKFTSYNGNSIFLHYIGQKKFRHFFIGNTTEVLDSLKNNLTKIDPSISNMTFKELPFLKVEDFDYKNIAEEINLDSADLIWVSLGAPKQEIFMSKLLPFLDKGVMVGVGAAFNFNASTGNVKRAPQWMINIRLEWLYRAFEEPKKNVPRYCNFLKILPKLYLEECKK
ncbi:MAG: WecB/TagA/CpsF family glycosyltransferase [Bacteroidales bacterium]|nr:WecB/TagA/CpsF family glycosyltransferase [Bacteroidales bacterium]